MLDWVEVESSNIKEVGYDDECQVLGVRFKSGDEYRYEGVTVEEYVGLLGSESPGGYLHREIKPKHEGVKQYEREEETEE